MNSKKKRIMVFGFALLAVLVMVLAVTGLIEEGVGVCIALTMTVIFTLVIALMAYKSDVKILSVLMVIFMIIGVLLLGYNVVNLLKGTEDKDTLFIKVKEDRSDKTLQFEYENKKYYTYHLNSIDLTKDGITKSLSEAIQSKTVTLDEILELTIPNSNTNGYKIYYDGGNSKDGDKYSVVVCETSNHVIFANYSYTYDESICVD